MARVEKSPEIWHRNDFSVLCNWRKLWLAAEVGVDRGEFSQAFLALWQGWGYLGVDDYKPYPGMPWNRDCDKQIAGLRYERYAHKAKLAIGSSLDVAAELMVNREMYGNRLFDFIYIDGCHLYENVKVDLAAWWPLLSENGIFAGHDFDDTHPGVIQAVSEFAETLGLTVYLTQDKPESWYIYRSGIPGPDWVRNP